MIFYALTISVTIFGLCVAKELPIPLTTCERNSVDYSSCLTDAAQESWLKIVKGFPEIDFPSLDPLSFDHFDFKYNNDMIDAELNLSNVKVKGLGEMRFLAVRPHFLEDAFHLEVEVLVPKEHGTGDLKADLRLGTWKIDGEGYFDMSRTFRTTWNITGHVKDDTWIVEHFYVPSISSENLQVNLDNLIDNKMIRNLLTDFINRNGNTLSQALISVEMIFMEPLLVNLLNQLFSKVPFSAVFP